jgi:hypothetical protein
LIEEKLTLHLKQHHQKKKDPKFTQPSLSEVAEYAKSISFQLDAQKFIDHYTATGWMIGKNRMVDWKAAVRTWRKEVIHTAPKAAVLCDCGCGRELTKPSQYAGNAGKFFDDDCRKKVLGW